MFITVVRAGLARTYLMRKAVYELYTTLSCYALFENDDILFL